MPLSAAFKKLDLSKSDLEKTLEHKIFTITDENGTIIFANKAFCDLSKYSEDELIGQNHRILKSGEHDENFSRICGIQFRLVRYGWEK